LFGSKNRAVAAARNTLPQLMLTMSKTTRDLEADHHLQNESIEDHHLQNESIEDTDSSEDEVKPRGREGKETTGKGAHRGSG